MKPEIAAPEPELTTCPDCKLELELDQSETLARRFTCPECGTEFGLDADSIDKRTPSMIERGQVPLRHIHKLDFWYSPLSLYFFAILILNPFSKQQMPITMGFIFLILGIVNTYRAIVSLRLTCLPSSDSLSRKIAIVRSLQEKFEWTLTNGRNGSFEFYDKRGLNPRVITFICKEDAYYYNCMVHAFRAGSGVSITQTLQVAKAIKALTAKSGNIQISGRLTSRSS